MRGNLLFEQELLLRDIAHKHLKQRRVYYHSDPLLTIRVTFPLSQGLNLSVEQLTQLQWKSACISMHQLVGSWAMPPTPKKIRCPGIAYEAISGPKMCVSQKSCFICCSVVKNEMMLIVSSLCKWLLQVSQ